MFKAVTAEQKSFAYVVSDFIHKDVPDAVVEKLVKATYDKRNELVSNIATLREGRFTDMYDVAIEYDLSVPFHPAAAKFYQETLGVTIPEKLMPPK